MKNGNEWTFSLHSCHQKSPYQFFPLTSVLFSNIILRIKMDTTFIMLQYVFLHIKTCHICFHQVSISAPLSCSFMFTILHCVPHVKIICLHCRVAVVRSTMSAPHLQCLHVRGHEYTNPPSPLHTHTYTHINIIMMLIFPERVWTCHLKSLNVLYF